MMNLCSLSKAIIANKIIVIISICKILWDLLSDKPLNFMDLLYVFIMLCLGIYILLNNMGTKNIILGINDVLLSWKNGDFEVRLNKYSTKGLLGKLIRNCNNYIDTCDAFMRESLASIEAVNSAKFFRKIMTQGLKGIFKTVSEKINANINIAKENHNIIVNTANHLDNNIESIIVNIRDNAANVKDIAGQTLDSSEESLSKSSEVLQEIKQVIKQADKANELLMNFKDIINVINVKIKESEKTAKNADIEAQKASKVINTLLQSSQEIMAIVDSIDKIASQTTLLALNATIEAARAGEAGKGFSIVAGEVKSLANQIIELTKNINSQIQNIQNITTESVNAIYSISSSIVNVNEDMAKISGAINQQDEATKDLLECISGVSNSIQNKADNEIIDMEVIARSTKIHANNVMDNIINLSSQLEDLHSKIKAFTSTLVKKQ